jgi:hypothetical protein
LAQAARNKPKVFVIAALVLVALRACVSYGAIHTGFRAISDDDYSRVVIAQVFAAQPVWDPSATSWLPFPFWLYGFCLSALGASLAKARAIAMVISLVGPLGVWLAGRWLGLSRIACLIAGIISCAIPYAAWLGVATTPDYFTALLLLLGACSLARRCEKVRLLGALAIAAACLSRYEAWPVAVLWAAISALDGLRHRNWKFMVLAGLVLAAPLAWMLNGALNHHDALFFIKRVVTYKRALGLPTASVLSRLLATPRHLLVDAPELWAVAVLVAILATLKHKPFLKRRWCRPIVAILSLLVFLCMGDLSDGAATHHVGRTLLMPWFFLALILAAGVTSVARDRSLRHRALLALLLIGAYSFVFCVLRPTFTSVDGFCARNEETEVGTQASSRVPMGEKLAIDTLDYGYFAVEAAFGRPKETVILDSHDPRHPKAANIFAAAETLSEALAKYPARWLVAPTKHERTLTAVARIHYRGPTLMLAELN